MFTLLCTLFVHLNDADLQKLGDDQPDSQVSREVNSADSKPPNCARECRSYSHKTNVYRSSRRADFGRPIFPRVSLEVIRSSNRFKSEACLDRAIFARDAIKLIQAYNRFKPESRHGRKTIFSRVTAGSFVHQIVPRCSNYDPSRATPKSSYLWRRSLGNNIHN